MTTHDDSENQENYPITFHRSQCIESDLVNLSLLTCEERSQTLSIPSRDPVMTRLCSEGENNNASTVDEETSSLKYQNVYAN